MLVIHDQAFGVTKFAWRPISHPQLDKLTLASFVTDKGSMARSPFSLRGFERAPASMRHLSYVRFTPESGHVQRKRKFRFGP
jgi:hypothetical protein